MKINNINRQSHPRLKLSLLSLALLATSSTVAANSFSNPKVTWTNNVQYNALFRVKDQDPALVRNAANNKSANIDDGNLSFDKGLVSNRLELFSELDVVYENGFGIRVSGIAWYDDVYNKNNDNPGFAAGAVPNQRSVGQNQFTADTRRVQGKDVELRDAFVFGRINLGDTILRLRAGQFATLWGESVFFAQNGIAGGQNAFDIDRLIRNPNSEAKEFVLPVPQLSLDMQLSSSLSVGAYYQFGFEPNRLPAVGSYFSAQDTGVIGAENMYVGVDMSGPVPRPISVPLTGVEEADDNGQYGLQLRWRLESTDLGFYVVRFHDKGYQQIVNISTDTPLPYPAGPESYYLTYHEDTTAYGISASHSFGAVNLAAEASIRKDMAFASTGSADASRMAPPGVLLRTNNTDNPAYAVGDSAHFNMSALWLLDPGALWNEASFMGELAWNRRLNCQISCAALDPNATRDALAMRFVFQPVYRQVLSGWDLGVPVGVGYSPNGSRSSVGPGYPAENGGDFTLGLNGTYLNSLQVNLSYTHFFGKADGFIVDRADYTDSNPAFSYQQSLKDRNFVSISARYRF